jgi:hypothetical protein
MQGSLTGFVAQGMILVCSKATTAEHPTTWQRKHRNTVERDRGLLNGRRKAQALSRDDTTSESTYVEEGTLPTESPEEDGLHRPEEGLSQGGDRKDTSCPGEQDCVECEQGGGRHCLF